MKNKKRNLIIFSTLLVIVVGVYLLIPKTKEEESNRTKPNVNTNGFLTLMLEQDDGTYKKTSASTWPGDGYAFNNELSGCERGGELVYDRETNIVKLISGGSDKCYVYFDKYNVAKITNVTSSKTTNSVTLTVTTEAGENPIEKYYFSKDDGQSYQESTSNTYTFNNLYYGTTYNLRVYIIDTNGISSKVYTISVQIENGPLLADYIKGLYTSQGSNGIYYHTSSLEDSAADNSYRYAGVNPNNYVCFGSTASTCPSDNLYRIIGVFGSEAKLIKATSYGKYTWDSGNDNTWSTSDIKNTLNTTYLSSLSSTWQNKIATHTWKVGGMTWANGTNIPKIVYNYEVGSSSSSTTWPGKIGLMYVSDYAFATIPNFWFERVDIEFPEIDKRVDFNWLYLAGNEWFISRFSDYEYVFFMMTDGRVSSASWANSSRIIRPAFYLISSVKYAGGSGTSSDPIRIN